MSLPVHWRAIKSPLTEILILNGLAAIRGCSWQDLIDYGCSCSLKYDNKERRFFSSRI